MSTTVRYCNGHIPTFSARVLLIAVPVITSGCTVEYSIIPKYPTYEDAICVAQTQDWYKAPANSDRQAGRSTEVLTTGIRPTSLNKWRWAVTGAPGDENDEVTGFVRVTHIDIDTGLTATSAAMDQTLTPPASVGTTYQYGWDLLSTDIRECHAGETTGRWDGCGQELLVSAPDTFAHMTTGQVLWYVADGDIGDDTSNLMIEYQGTLTPPAGTSTSAEFGYAMAAPREVLDQDSPWDTAAYYPAWVAISAPGDDKVLIYTIDETQANPYTLAQTITAPTLGSPYTGRRFGHSLAVGDFDGLGDYPDLAIGTPMENGSDKSGQVFIYRGQSGSSPLNVTTSNIAHVFGGPFSASSSDVTHYGWSVAAGPIVSPHDRDILLVGAPEVGGTDNGGICQVELDDSGSGWATPVEKCWSNSFSSALYGGMNENLGWSLAIGNFHNSDSDGNDDTSEARVKEVAVSRPGYNFDKGAVDILVTGDSGFNEHSTWTSIQEWTGPYANARFGEGVSQGYLQESHWEDLVIGAPEHASGLNLDGSGSITKAVDNASCMAINGTWTADDVLGLPVDAKIWSQDGTPGSVNILLLDGYNYALYEDYGGPDERLCEYKDADGNWQDAVFTIPTGTQLTMSGSWSCSTSTKSWSGVDMTGIASTMASLPSGATAEMDVEMTLTSSTTLDVDATDWTFKISGVTIGMSTALAFVPIDEPDHCDPVGFPMEFELVTAGVCE